MVRGSDLVLVQGRDLFVQACAGSCAGFGIAQSVDTTGLEQSVQAVQGSFELKFFLEKKTCFKKNAVTNLKKPAHPAHPAQIRVSV